MKGDNVRSSDNPQTDDHFDDDFRVIENILREAHAPLAALDRLARIRRRLLMHEAWSADPGNDPIDVTELRTASGIPEKRR